MDRTQRDRWARFSDYDRKEASDVAVKARTPRHWWRFSKLARRHIVINVGKFAFCGLVVCLATLGGCLAEDPSDLTTEDESLVQGSDDSDVLTVYPEDGAETEAASLAGDIGIQAVVSFHRTCNGASFDVRVSDGAVLFAEASSCRRRNGTWTGYRSWRGVCHGNVANIDGNIRCNP
jgi:hypothetical protein